VVAGVAVALVIALGEWTGRSSSASNGTAE
jgi:hypothetical protein